MNTSKISIFLTILLVLSSCGMFKKDKKSSESNEIIKKKKRFEPNVFKRAEQAVENEGSIVFGGGKKTEQFGNYNVMWRATLDVFENLPIALADYSGSIISTDWYSSSSTSESVKIKVEFLSNDVKLSSIKVSGNKKICDLNLTSCKISITSKNFNSKIKDSIFSKVIELNRTKN